MTDHDGRMGRRGRPWRLRRLAVAAAVAIGVLGPAGAVRAGPVDSGLATPYGSADHTAYESCPTGQPAPSCAASAAADRRSGTVQVSAAYDSGLDGNLPGAGQSGALGEITSTVPLGSATAATFTVHIRIVRIGTAVQSGGRAYVSISAYAWCDQCAPADAPSALPERPGDQTLRLTLVRGTTGGPVATLDVLTFARAGVSCTLSSAAVPYTDYCLVAPGGAASAQAETVLTGVTVRLWGVGRPSMPRIDRPAPGATLRPTAHQTCDPQCRTVTGEWVSGTAEPGMPIEVLDGRAVLADGQADATGLWRVDVDLASGPHSLRATAVGPGGRTTSAPLRCDVSG